MKSIPRFTDATSQRSEDGSQGLQRRVSYAAPETGANSVVLPFPKEKIGLNSNHGVKPVRHNPALSPSRPPAQRARVPQAGYNGTTAKINQDRGVISYPLNDDPHLMLLAVYDGHGANGELVCSDPCPPIPPP